MAPPKKSRSSSKSKGTPKPAVVPPTDRYNPNSEPGELGPVIASNWEILRRVPAFQEVANQWIGSKSFRFEHALEQKAYKENVHARCALDWMLSPQERFDLAKFQMKNARFFWDPTANYGPIIVELHMERQTDTIGNCMDNVFDVKPDLKEVELLRLDQPWPATPGKFRAQFASLFGGDDLQEIPLGDLGLRLFREGNKLLSGHPLSSEKQKELGRYLFDLGERFRLYGEIFKIMAIQRSVFYSERAIDDILARIKASLPVDPKTGNDYESNRSFLGTDDQWSKFLAWEAHGRSTYRAAIEIIPQPAINAAQNKHLRGTLLMSTLQNRYKTSILQAVRAIQNWYDKIYPVRNLAPTSVQSPSD